jgi:GTP cyclohydrolase FolE2
MTDVKTLPDYACQVSDDRVLNKVGVRNVEIIMRDLEDERVLTNQSAYVSLENMKGAHMSRLMMVMQDLTDTDIEASDEILDMLCDTHDAVSTYWKCRWKSMYKGDPHFTFDAVLEGVKVRDTFNWYLTFNVPYASVCPCSHEMVKSVGHGIPHMQRSLVEVTGLVTTDDLGSLLSTGLSRVVDAVVLVPEPMMKRPDELDWCQRAAGHNMFVEDSARRVAEVIDDLFDDWVVKSEHQESIHQHNVVAVCKKGDQLV